MLEKYWKKLLPESIRKKLLPAVIIIAGVTALGGFLGNLNNFQAFYNSFVPVDNPESDIYGIWLSKYSYPVPMGIVENNGTTEYFKNNTYNYIGELGRTITTEAGSVYLLYSANGTGTWQADSESLTIRLEDLKSQLKTVYLNGESVNVYDLQSIYGGELPRIEDTLPSGMTEEYKIINTSDKIITLKTDAPNGKEFEFAMIKQTKRFNR